MRDASLSESRRQLLWIGAACAILIGAGIGLSGGSARESNAEILTQLPAINQQVRAQVAALRTAGNQSQEQRLMLAADLLALMRASGEEKLAGMIERLLVQSDMTQRLPAKLMLADLYQYQHRFDDALALLASVEDQTSGSAAYWRLRANLYRIRGQLEPMAKACARGAALDGGLWTVLCEVELDALRGDTARVNKRLDALATDHSDALHQQADLLTWAADLFDRAGRVEHAARCFRKALLLAPGPYLVDRLIQFQLMHEGADSAARTLRWWRQNGRAPAASWQLSAGLIAAANGDHAPATQLLLRMEQELSSQRLLPVTSVHWRELARLSVAIEPASDAARHYAIKNWHQQKEPIDAALLAQAASASGHTPTLEQLATELQARKMSGLHAELKLRGWL